MKASVAYVHENISLNESTFLLRLRGCEALADCQPGQFAMLRGDWGLDPVTPRAMSVMRVREGVADFVIKQVGRGTARLRQARVGDPISLLGPMGRGFPALDNKKRYDLVAGGVGLPPLLMLAERAKDSGLQNQLTFYYGGRSASDLVLLEQVRALGCHLVLTTEDGSLGVRGRVTDALQLEEAVVLACGPNPMLKAVRAMALARGLSCWLSIEENMACAVRACLGCAVPARSRPYLYVCTDGPVFDAREIWP